MLVVRLEEPSDYDAIAVVVDDAFGEAERRPLSGLVNDLRANGHDRLSLVADVDGVVVGHVLFSPFFVETADGQQREFLALGPLAVSPDHQRQGIGSQLVRDGLDACRRMDASAVFLLGSPRYYGRFGFEPVLERGLRYEKESALPFPEAWQCVELVEGALTGVTGVGRFSPEFDDYE